MQIARKVRPLLVFAASLGAHASKKKLIVPPNVLVRLRGAVEANSDTPPLNYMRAEILDPSSKTILWNFTTAFANNNKMTAQQQINEIIPYFLKAWNGVFGKDHI